MTKRGKLTLGIDEAGRGPAIGPLVMAAVVVDTKAATALTRAGVTDSKAYGAGAAAHQIRTGLAAQIEARATWFCVRVVGVNEVDRRVLRGELNLLEREVAREFIDQAPPCDQIIADGATLFRPLMAHYPHLQARDGGEALHAAVAAASVLAKVARDEAFQAFATRYVAEFGQVRGGGYVNDATREFLRAFAKRHRTVPDELRLSWPHPYLADLVDLDALKIARFGRDAAGPQMNLF